MHAYHFNICKSLAESAAPNNLCFCLVSQSKEEISLSLITAGGQMSVEENTRLMKMLDDVWNAQDGISLTDAILKMWRALAR